MQPMTKTDIVIVGGGPSGAAAAITARSYGFRVVVLEREVGAKMRPGEAAHPGIEPLLLRLGVLDAVSAADFVRYEGHWVARALAATTPPLGRQRRLTWRPHAGRRLDAGDIGQVQSTDTGTEVTVCTIARIGQDDTGGDTCRMGCADLIERDLRLGFEPDILRHMRLFPPCRIICPGLRQIEPVSDRRAINVWSSL